MTKIVLKAMGTCLTPTDWEGFEVVQGLPYGELVMCDVRQARSPGNHKRFFKFLRTAFANHDRYTNIELFRKYIQMAAGHYDEFITPKGETIYLPRSIDWETLEEIEFKKLFKECINAYLERFQPELTEEQFLKAIAFD